MLLLRTALVSEREEHLGNLDKCVMEYVETRPDSCLPVVCFGHGRTSLMRVFRAGPPDSYSLPALSLPALRMVHARAPFGFA